MKEVPITWQIASKIYFRHLNKVNRISLCVAVLINLIVVGVALITGFPLSKIPHSPWFMLEIIIIVLIRVFPVNIWVVKNHWNKPSKDGHYMILVNDKESAP